MNIMSRRLLRRLHAMRNTARATGALSTMNCARRRFTSPLLALAAWCFSSTAGNAAVIVLEPHQDALLYEDATGVAANGSGEFLLIGRTNQSVGSRRRSLLEFDLSSLPNPELLTKVTLRLHLVTVTTVDLTIGLHRVTTAWTAGTSDPTGNESQGVTAVLGDSTWLHSSMPTLWSTPGGDFAPTASAQALVTSTSGNFEWSSTGLLDDVKQFILTPSLNHGWLMMGDESIAQSAKRFESMNSATVDFRPRLILEYADVPECSVSILILLSGFYVTSKRKRSRGIA